MEKLDIARKIKGLNGPIGLPRDFAYDINWAVANNAVWGACDGFASHIVMAILVGQSEDAIRLLPKAIHWKEIAMKLEEDANRSGSGSHWYGRRLYSLMRWLSGGVHDTESLAS
jgi:hypothetical protein